MIVLSMEVGFCPDNALDKFTLVKDLHLFTRKLFLKTFFLKRESKDEGIDFLQSLSESECKALRELLTSEEDPSHLPATPPEIDLIDHIDLELLFDT